MDSAAQIFQSSNTPSLSADRAATGIPGLDDILYGGLPRRRLYLVQGDPGTGKTTLALQFLLEGRNRGEIGLYISLSESRSELESVAVSHGWDLAGLDCVEMSADESALVPDTQNTLFHSSEVELSETTERILAEIDRVTPTRVVFDSLSEWRLMSGDSLRFRRQILALKHHLSLRGATVLLLDEKSVEVDKALQSLAHGVLTLEQLRPEYGAERRRIHVVKMRGMRFRGGYHDLSIRTGGLEIFPRLVAAEHSSRFVREMATSGLDELDELLGGGVARGTATLLMGAAGAGKSMLSQQWVHAFLLRGEKAAIFAFEESHDLTLERARRVGFDFESAIENGTLHLQSVDPAEISPGEFAHQVRQMVEQQGVRLLVIDSLNGYLYAMPQERHLILHMHELLSYLSTQGVVTILIAAQGGVIGSNMSNPVDISYLADTVVLLRHFEAFGQVLQAVSVLKKRSGAHERSIRELQLSSAGAKVGRSLTEFRGVLSGVPEFIGNGNPFMGEAISDEAIPT